MYKSGKGRFDGLLSGSRGFGVQNSGSGVSGLGFRV